MAEVVVAVSLAAAVAGLLDVSARLISKLDDIRSTCQAFDQTNSQLTGQLRLLTTALSHIQKQAEMSGASTDNVIAVLRVIKDTSAQGECLNRALEKLSSPRTTSITQRLFGTMASSKLGNKCQEAMTKMRSNIEILTLYQQTIVFDNVEVVRDLLLQNLMNTNSDDTYEEPRKLGLVLSTAPVLDLNSFVGREAELAELDSCLYSRRKSYAQRIVSIVGTGGVGKTQLSLAYARKYAHHFTSTFWLDADGLADVRQSMARSWDCVCGDQSAQASTPDQKAELFRGWLAEPWNDQWLLIFNNHDNPQVPGDCSPGAYDLQTLFPSRTHGNILITTRSTELVYTKRIYLKELENIDLSLDLMSQRAGRDITKGE